MKGNNHLFSLTIDEPGVGKTHELLAQSFDDAKLGRPVYIMTPTNASKQNIIAQIYKRMATTALDSEKRALQKLVWSVLVLESSYNGEPYVYIDEIGQVSTSYFNSLLMMLQSVPYAEVNMFGDVKQLKPSSQSFSPLESLMRNNLVVPSFWDFVADKCYDDFDYDTFNAPKTWLIKKPIDITLLTQNRRLRRLGYTNYNNDFFDDVIETRTIEKADYTQDLTKAVNDYSAILVATKSRGEEADDIIFKALGNDQTIFEAFAPFISANGHTYLNPDHADFDKLEKALSGVPVVDSSVNTRGAVHHYWATVHAMQGISIKSVTFYMGNQPIGNRHAEHYSQNLLYTSITRASDEITLLGLKDSFLKMRHQQPDNPQKKLGNYKADQAVTKLFDALLNQEGREFKSFDKVLRMYDEIFEKTELATGVAQTVSEFNVRLDKYSEHELKMQFKNFPSSDAIVKGFKPNYKKFYEDEIASTNGAKFRGKGKVQAWVNSLSDEELADLKADTDLSRAKFKAKWNRDKRQVVKALEELNEKQSA